MNRKFIVFCTIVSMALLFGGCANRNMQNQHSGFLKDYEGLDDHPKFDGAMVRIMPDADFTKYQNIIVAPVQIISNIPESEVTPSQKKLFGQISTYLTKGYIQNFKQNGSYNVVDVPGPDTMKFEVAISAVEVHFDDMKWYQFTPVTLGLTVVARATYIDQAVRILGEARLSDSESGKVLLRAMSLQEGEEVGTEADQLLFADVKPALDVWLKRSTKRLNEMKKGLIK
jgi:hypothetical protein